MRPSTRAHRHSDQPSELRIILAISSIGAGVIHAAVVPEHLEEGAIFGFFFILAAGFELAWAMAVLFRPTVIVYTIGALANGATIGVWLVSRTIGLPIGPDPWMPEEIQSLDAAVTSLELLLVIGGVLLLRHAHGRVRGAGPDGLKGSKATWLSACRQAWAPPERTRQVSASGSSRRRVGTPTVPASPTT